MYFKFLDNKQKEWVYLDVMDICIVILYQGGVLDNCNKLLKYGVVYYIIE